MSADEAQRGGPAARAVILVRNTVTHDNRVLREVETLQRAGFAVQVLGSASSEEPAGPALVHGVAVVRIDPRDGRRRKTTRPPGPEIGLGPGRRPAVTSRPGAWPRPRLRRLLLTLSFNLRTALRCVRARPELIHANDYNTMWIALAAKLACGSRVIYDSHELWPDRNGRPEWRPWLVACEALFLRVADTVITASPGYAEAIARRYRVPRPVVVRNIPAGGDAGTSAGAPDLPLAVYVGGLMPGRGLERAIEALALVPGLRMALVGPGGESYRAGLSALAARAGVAGRVQLRGPVAPDQVVAALAGASFGVMLIEPVCLSYELTLPNKLFEYAAAGIPMLAADLPVIGTVVREHALGEVVAPDDVQQVAAAMARLLEPDRNRELRRRVRAFAAANRWEAERDRLSAVYRRTPGTG